MMLMTTATTTSIISLNWSAQPEVPLESAVGQAPPGVGGAHGAHTAYVG